MIVDLLLSDPHRRRVPSEDFVFVNGPPENLVVIEYFSGGNSVVLLVYCWFVCISLIYLFLRAA
jgi:hypothetical protein